MAILAICAKPDFTTDVEAIDGILNTNIANNAFWSDGVFVVNIDTISGLVYGNSGYVDIGL